MKRLLGVVMAGVGLVAGACADEIKLSDTFIDASNWSLSQNWKLTDDGQMSVSAGGGSFLFLKDRKNASELSFEADVTPMAAKSSGWKLTGLAIFQDGKNFWALSLVESPDKDKTPKRHFIEMKEMKNGKWGAESAISKGGVFKNTSFNWAYDTTYRLKMTMSAQGISGQVMDKSGKVLSEIGYKFTGDAIKNGTPALRVSGMTTNFDNVEINGK